MEHSPLQQNSPLRIAVVGHTNTGKTSLLRTLTRDSRFGQVSIQHGTTRHVEAAQLMLDGTPVIELFDTPGIEDPIALLERVDRIASDNRERLDGPARLQAFLYTDDATGRFEQEAKVIRQMLGSDAAFYVVDARDPVLAKHQDELELLRYCGIPLLPLLNFIASPQNREAKWREALARAGLHAMVGFDTVAPAEDAERLLYSKLATLMDQHKPILDALLQRHEDDSRTRQSSALKQLAELLIDVAACRYAVESGEQSAVDAATSELHALVKAREQLCVDTLLTVYRFSDEELEQSQLPMINGRWEQDLFDPYTLEQMGIRLGGGALAGASVGAGIDMMTGGLTLGAATAIGALAGGGLQTLRHYGQQMLDRIVSGKEVLRVDDNILRLLALRQLALIRMLESRGHAATGKLVALSSTDHVLWKAGLPAPLREARANPQWSGLTHPAALQSRRSAAIEELTQILAGIRH